MTDRKDLLDDMSDEKQHAFLNELSKKQLQIMLLRQYSDLSEDEIAEKLFIKPGTYNSQMQRIRDKKRYVQQIHRH